MRNGHDFFIHVCHHDRAAHLWGHFVVIGITSSCPCLDRPRSMPPWAYVPDGIKQRQLRNIGFSLACHWLYDSPLASHWCWCQWRPFYPRAPFDCCIPSILFFVFYTIQFRYSNFFGGGHAHLGQISHVNIIISTVHNYIHEDVYNGTYKIFMNIAKLLEVHQCDIG